MAPIEFIPIDALVPTNGHVHHARVEAPLAPGPADPGPRWPASPGQPVLCTTAARLNSSLGLLHGPVMAGAVDTPKPQNGVPAVPQVKPQAYSVPYMYQVDP